MNPCEEETYIYEEAKDPVHKIVLKTCWLKYEAELV